MVSGHRRLVAPRTVNAFRDACCNWSVLRDIHQAFENEAFAEAPDDVAPGEGWYARGGQRRGTFDRYVHGLDWGDPAQVRRVLNVFEEILSWGPEEGRQPLVDLLERDGLYVDDRGRIITSPTASLADLPLSGLRDPAAILEHVERISRSADSDPPLAISGAKALIEATTKLVLEELGEPYGRKDDIPALVKAAQKALALHADAVAPTARGADAIKRIFSGLSGIAIGLAELRNEYGPDHGRARGGYALAPRHAHLAIGSAATYCRMLLETLEARRQAAAPAPQAS